ncbi:unnamed protein product [Nezara viridula]|uniref:Uncharacterized protein n=1 Tax=Nezara viridula TaxID=85310 RepID=A0A9P0H9H8_NEZVI|nr:unnamed protein product [Nezara viridula]
MCQSTSSSSSVLLQRTSEGWHTRYLSEHVHIGWTRGYTRENGALVEVQGVPDSRMGVFVNDCWKHLLGGGQGGGIISIRKLLVHTTRTYSILETEDRTQGLPFTSSVKDQKNRILSGYRECLQEPGGWIQESLHYHGKELSSEELARKRSYNCRSSCTMSTAEINKRESWVSEIVDYKRVMEGSYKTKQLLDRPVRAGGRTSRYCFLASRRKRQLAAEEPRDFLCILGLLFSELGSVVDVLSGFELITKPVQLTKFV